MRFLRGFSRALGKCLSLDFSVYGFYEISPVPSGNWLKITSVYIGDVEYVNRIEGRLVGSHMLIHMQGSKVCWGMDINKVKQSGDRFRPLLIKSTGVKVSFGFPFDDKILRRIR